MFWEEDKKSKPKVPKYAHKHEVIIAEQHEYQAQKFLAEIPQIYWILEKTFGGKNKYILQSDSKHHIDYFLHMFNSYIVAKDNLAKSIAKDKIDIRVKGIEGEICLGSLEHIRFRSIDGSWYGNA